MNLVGHAQFGQLPVVGFAESGPILEIDLLDWLAHGKALLDGIEQREMDR